MGASDSKLHFKQGIFRLSEERHIPADDPYWRSFWLLPESSEDIFSLFAPADIRRTRDQALENLETLILAVTSRLFILRHHPSFPDPDLAPERDALNCIRILTRILPYLYESESLQSWEEKFFWGARRVRSRPSPGEVLFDETQDEQPQAPKPKDPESEFNEAKPLAEELIDTLVDLLFFSDFTMQKQPRGQAKVSYAIWQSGVGCNTAVPTTKEFESRRAEILRLLLALASQSMYLSSSALPLRGVRALTYMCGSDDKQVVLSLMCSLLNTTLKYNPVSWRVPYNTLLFKDPRQILVTYALQFLLVLLLYAMPEQDGTPSPTAAGNKNFYRHFLGRMHRPQDFQFIVDGMTRILNQPLQEKTSLLPGTQSSTKFAPEMIMLFWEITQCNKRFRSFIIDTDRAHDFTVITIFYSQEYKNDASKQGVVRMCAFLMQTLSVEKNFGINLNRNFDGQDSLPQSIKVPDFRGTYADFLIQSIYSLITTSHGRLSAIYPALLAVINNIAPYLEGLSPASSSSLMQLFSSMSSPSFLLANEINHDLLRSLLESINSIVEHQYKKNPDFIFAILKTRKRIEALRTFTLESGQEEIERRNRRRKEAAANGETVDDNSLRGSVDSVRSPTTAQPQTTSLASPAGEDDTFAIGDDEDESDDEPHPTPAQSTTSENTSQADSSAASNVEDAVPQQIRGMSEKARGKMPAGARSFSRQNSTTSLGGYSAGGQSQGGGAFEPTAEWIETWLPELPLHTALAVIQQVTAVLPRQALAGDRAAPETLRRVQELRLVGVEAATVRVHTFEWSPLALGWYESLLWGLVFSSEAAAARGSAGIWNATHVRLFRVQEAAPEGPTLTSPRGAVDAVGSNIVSRIGAINLRPGGGAATAPAGAGGAGAGAGAAPAGTAASTGASQ